MRTRTTRRRHLVLGVSLLSVLCLACLGEVEGERSMSGSCPDGEICSSETPLGLRFVGRTFFDESNLRLGPVLVGGTLDLGLRTEDGSPLPDFVVDSDGTALRASLGEGTFGPTNEEGQPLYHVDGHVTLHPDRPGTEYVRIVDAASGALFDRLEIEAVALDTVDVVIAQEPEREALYAGCEEMVGVRLIAGQADLPVRGFDEGMAVSANGESLQPEPLFWDCVTYEVGAAEAEVTFEVRVAGRVFHRSLPVQPLPVGQSCPEMGD